MYRSGLQAVPLPCISIIIIIIIISRLTVVSRVAKKNSPHDATESLFMCSKTTERIHKTNLPMNPTRNLVSCS